MCPSSAPQVDCANGIGVHRQFLEVWPNLGAQCHRHEKARRASIYCSMNLTHKQDNLTTRPVEKFPLPADRCMNGQMIAKHAHELVTNSQ